MRSHPTIEIDTTARASRGDAATHRSARHRRPRRSAGLVGELAACTTASAPSSAASSPSPVDRSTPVRRLAATASWPRTPSTLTTRAPRSPIPGHDDAHASSLPAPIRGVEHRRARLSSGVTDTMATWPAGLLWAGLFTLGVVRGLGYYAVGRVATSEPHRTDGSPRRRSACAGSGPAPCSSRTRSTGSPAPPRSPTVPPGSARRASSRSSRRCPRAGRRSRPSWASPCGRSSSAADAVAGPDAGPDHPHSGHRP